MFQAVITNAMFFLADNALSNWLSGENRVLCVSGLLDIERML